MQRGQKFIAVSKSSGKRATKYSKSGVYTVLYDHETYIDCEEIAFRGGLVQIFRSVFDIVPSDNGELT